MLLSETDYLSWDSCRRQRKGGSPLPVRNAECVPMLGHNEKLMISIQKKAYFSDRTLKLLERFDYKELPHVDQLIADFFVLNDTARSDLFEYIKIMKRSHTNPTRQDILDNVY